MANVKLSKEELELVTNAEMILTKNRIIGKVYDLFGELSDLYRRENAPFPAEVLAIQPKIAKGEQYLELPWVMLDYPRAFSATDVFAVRSFFWWGRYFSIKLQLQGRYRQQFRAPVKQYLDKKPGDWWICINEDPWHHHFEATNYLPYSTDIEFDKLPFIKLAKKIPLQQWDDSFDFFSGTFREIGTMLGTQPVE